MSFEPANLPCPQEQAEHLIALGVPAQFGLSDQSTRAAANHFHKAEGALLVPTGSPASYTELVGLLRYQDKPGFVVEDFTDADQFALFEGTDQKLLNLPESSWYLAHGPQRGDEFGNASPAEALAAITAKKRVALSMVEGTLLAIQAPEVLERNFCYMTIASRKRKSKGGFDARTPALWISNGTGRDGIGRKNAPKLGWCWWKNRHTWLGIAHAANREFSN